MRPRVTQGEGALHNVISTEKIDLIISRSCSAVQFFILVVCFENTQKNVAFYNVTYVTL